MMKKRMYQTLAAVGVLALCVTCATVAGAVSQHVTLTGWISCTTCLLPNTCKAQTRLSCVQTWVSQGASYVLVVGNAHYRLSGDDKALAKAAGDTVTITGELNGAELLVTSIDTGRKEK
jgi:hypothetical protein